MVKSDTVQYIKNFCDDIKDLPNPVRAAIFAERIPAIADRVSQEVVHAIEPLCNMFTIPFLIHALRLCADALASAEPEAANMADHMRGILTEEVIVKRVKVHGGEREDAQ